MQDWGIIVLSIVAVLVLLLVLLIFWTFCCCREGSRCCTRKCPPCPPDNGGSTPPTTGSGNLDPQSSYAYGENTELFDFSELFALCLNIQNEPAMGTVQSFQLIDEIGDPDDQVFTVTDGGPDNVLNIPGAPTNVSIRNTGGTMPFTPDGGSNICQVASLTINANSLVTELQVRTNEDGDSIGSTTLTTNRTANTFVDFTQPITKPGTLTGTYSIANTVCTIRITGFSN